MPSSPDQRDSLRVGDNVDHEGPYGRFDFVGRDNRSIWGGGFGITPFVVRMKELARHPGDKPVDLIYAIREHDPQVIERLTKDAKEAGAGIGLHVLWEDCDGRLTPARLTELVPDSRKAEVWFCGLSGCGNAIRNGLFAVGLAKSQFDQKTILLVQSTTRTREPQERLCSSWHPKYLFHCQ